MRILGVVGALFLILYATFLGTQGEVYTWLRRYGVTIYFSFTALAQIFFTRRLYQLGDIPELRTLRPLVHIKMSLCVLQWGIGLISVPLGVIIVEKAPREVMQNIVEWNFALAMNLYFFITYFMFKRTGFAQSFMLQKTKTATE